MTTLIFPRLVEDLAACCFSCWTYWQNSRPYHETSDSPRLLASHCITICVSPLILPDLTVILLTLTIWTNCFLSEGLQHCRDLRGLRIFIQPMKINASFFVFFLIHLDAPWVQSSDYLSCTPPAALLLITYDLS